MKRPVRLVVLALVPREAGATQGPGTFPFSHRQQGPEDKEHGYSQNYHPRDHATADRQLRPVKRSFLILSGHVENDVKGLLPNEGQDSEHQETDSG